MNQIYTEVGQVFRNWLLSITAAGGGVAADVVNISIISEILKCISFGVSIGAGSFAIYLTILKIREIKHKRKR